MQILLVAGCLRFGGSFTDTAVVMLCVCMRLAHVGMLYMNGMCAWHAAYRIFVFGHKVPFLSLLFLLQGVLVVVPLDAAVASWTYRPTVDCQGLWSLFKENESGEKMRKGYPIGVKNNRVQRKKSFAIKITAAFANASLRSLRLHFECQWTWHVA